MSKIHVSVCICTHAPEMGRLSRVLEALSVQALSASMWEVLLVENSEQPSLDVSLLSPLSCHSKLMHESKPGKVHAMVTGAQAARGDWIVFVDDDNILFPDYLANLLKLSEAFPQIGVFSASIQGEFTAPVPDWARPYLNYLAVRELSQPQWANCHPAPVGPIGAGMCVKRELMHKFLEMYRRGEIGCGLTRTKDALTGGADDTLFMEIAFQSGYGCGAFPDLQHTHVIPASRLELNYLKLLVHDLTASHTVLGARWTKYKPSRIKAVARLALDLLSAFSIASPEQRAIEMAKHRGRYAGIRQLSRMRKAA